MEIIPNWHPIFVHFTFGVFSTAVILYLSAYGLSIISPFPLYVDQLKISALWCLSFSGLFTFFFTLGAGLYAFMTVQHTDEAHPHMLLHQNWGLPTGLSIILIASFASWFAKTTRRFKFFLLILILFQILVIYTGWLGSELVYRHGVGVLPVSKSSSHHHISNEVSRSHEQ